MAMKNLLWVKCVFLMIAAGYTCGVTTDWYTHIPILNPWIFIALVISFIICGIFIKNFFLRTIMMLSGGFVFGWLMGPMTKDCPFHSLGIVGLCIMTIVLFLWALLTKSTMNIWDDIRDLTQK